MLATGELVDVPLQRRRALFRDMDSAGARQGLRSLAPTAVRLAAVRARLRCGGGFTSGLAAAGIVSVGTVVLVLGWVPR
jgi:hypothetical protein